MKILIVDDDKSVAALLRTLLRAYGDTDVAHDGAEALAKFKLAHEESRPFELICLDIMMPNVSGPEALKLIRSEEQARGVGKDNAAYIVIVSVVDDSEVLDGLMRGGANAYLSKDEAMAKLPDTMRSLGIAPKC